MLTTKWPERGGADVWSARNSLRGELLHSAWTEMLSRFQWEWFCTLTFDPKRVSSCGHSTASREAFRWCNDSARVMRRNLGWVYAPERTRSGAWHVHALLLGGISDVDIRAPRAMWQARNGNVDVRPVVDVRGAALYSSKEAARTGELVWSDSIGSFRIGTGEQGAISLVS